MDRERIIMEWIKIALILILAGLAIVGIDKVAWYEYRLRMGRKDK
jgi:hypothetical protein